MAVTTSNTNKPILPRGADVRPIDSYNRAALYSGKALDFDGVNDLVTISDNAAVDFGTGDFSIAFIMKSSVAGYGRILDKRSNTNGYTLSIDTNKKMVLEMNVGAGNQNFTTSKRYADGEIKHVVISADRSGNASFYINGALDEEIDITSRIGDLNSTSDLFIGVDAPSGVGLSYEGELSGLKMYSTALTAAQVADLYNNPEKVVPTGVADSALKLWLPMMEGAGTTAINGAPDALGSEMIINGTFDTGSNWNYDSARWEIIDGKAKFKDTVAGPVFQSGLTFDTSKTYVLTFEISDTTNAQIWIGNSAGSNDYTISSSYHVYSNGRQSLLLRGSDIGASETTLAFYGNNSGSTFSIDNISLKEVANCGTISGATWTHGIGSPVAQTSVIDWNKWQLEGGSTTNEYLIPQGLTSGRDLLGNVFENVRKQGALNLDGKSWAEVHDNASLDITDAITLEAWVNNKTGELSTNNRYMPIFDKATAQNGTNGFTLRLYSSYSANGGYFAVGGSFVTFDFTAGSYQHIVVTLEANSQKIYINGALQDTYTNAWTITQNGSDLLIGYAPSDGQQWLNASIAQPRIYNRALTASEVLNNYQVQSETYFTGLLDKYSGAAAAYSLRLLDSTYTGPAVKVRRSSDNAEKDIYFKYNELDTALLESFAGSGDAFVTTWYDQSGNGYDATQTTASSQPQIVSGGTSLGYIENKIVLNGTLQANYFYNQSNYSVFQVIQNFGSAVFGGTNNSGKIYATAQSGSATNATIGFANPSYYSNGVSIGVSRNDIHQATSSFSELTSVFDGANYSVSMGYEAATQFQKCRYKEFVIYPNQTISRTGVEDNIITHYGF